MSKVRPILFSAPMIVALLSGSKTQTRRVCKEMNAWVDQQCREVRTVDGWPYHFLKGAIAPIGKLNSPYGQPGDRLWVRENFAPNAGDEMAFQRWEFDSSGPKPEIHFAADGGDPHISRWRPSIHMPRWASRIQLEIVSVRVERLQDISYEDARAEGVSPLVWAGILINGYKALWEGINGAGSWDANPYVWVVEFKTVLS
jgi:hypothetical protein